MSSTAWDAMLTAILDAGLRIVGTWPIHATTQNRQIGQGTNALASYVVLVCRPQLSDARSSTVRVSSARCAPSCRGRFGNFKKARSPPSTLAKRRSDRGWRSSPATSRWSSQPGAHDSALGVGADQPGPRRGARAVRGRSRPRDPWAMTWYRDHGFADGPFDDAEKINKTVVTSLESLERDGIARGCVGRLP